MIKITMDFLRLNRTMFKEYVIKKSGKECIFFVHKDILFTEIKPSYMYFAFEGIIYFGLGYISKNEFGIEFPYRKYIIIPQFFGENITIYCENKKKIIDKVTYKRQNLGYCPLIKIKKIYLPENLDFSLEKKKNYFIDIKLNFK